jgi:hypothetical protein
MKTKLSILTLSAAMLLAAGCSTVDSRIARNRAVFNTWPADVQEAVAAGKIGVGFTPDQVQMALGRPDWAWTSTSADGTSQVWSYRDNAPRFGFGFGVGGWGRRGGWGLGMDTVTPRYYGERMRVVFDPAGHVSRIEAVTQS